MLDDTPLLDLLQRHVAPHVRWHRQRLCFLAALLPALIKLGTVNFAKLSVALGAKPASNYRRIQRFFAEAKLPQKAVAAFVLHLLPAHRQLVIAIDRTTWYFGRTPINIFMASVVHDGTAFPLVWIMLDKGGSSSGAEQRALVRKLLLVVPPERIRIVLGDREFIGKPLMSYLTLHKLGYAIRIRKDARVSVRGRSSRADALFADLAVGEHRRLRTRRLRTRRLRTRRLRTRRLRTRRLRTRRLRTRRLRTRRLRTRRLRTRRLRTRRLRTRRLRTRRLRTRRLRTRRLRTRRLRTRRLRTRRLRTRRLRTRRLRTRRLRTRRLRTRRLRTRRLRTRRLRTRRLRTRRLRTRRLRTRRLRTRRLRTRRLRTRRLRTRRLRTRRLRTRRQVYQQSVWLYGLRLPDGPKAERRLLLVVGTVRRLLRVYRLRWGIEVLFGGLKTRGFDFETTHLRASRRLSTLVGVLALAYSLASATGRHLCTDSPIPIKRHGRRARSVFRRGLDHLRHVLLRSQEQIWVELVALFRTGHIGPLLVPT